MVPGEAHLFAAARAIELGLPPIGFLFLPAEELVVTDLDRPAEEGGAVVRAEEREADRLVGSIEVALFGASLIIDRAGVLGDLARAAAHAALVAPIRARLLGEGEVELASGTSGHRIDALLQLDDEGRSRPDCPYASWLALASQDAVVPGGVVISVRSAAPIWRAATGMLNSLEIFGSSAVSSRSAGHGSARAARLDLPVIRRR